jgi:Ecdysteroid kinase-like family
LYSSDAPNEVIFLEDLTDQAYAVVDPSVGLNRAQAKQAMEKLAFFHAASVLMLNKVNTIGWVT